MREKVQISDDKNFSFTLKNISDKKRKNILDN